MTTPRHYSGHTVGAATASIWMWFVTAILPLCATARTLDVRDPINIGGNNAPLLLRDVVHANGHLSAAEEAVVVADMDEFDTIEQLGLVELAYRLQRHQSLRDVRLRGRRWMRFRRVSNPEQLAYAKEMIVQNLREQAPWRDWEFMLKLSADDESRLVHAARHQLTAVRLVDRRKTLGHVSLNTTWSPANHDRDIEITITPRITRKIHALVLARNLPAGQVISAHDVEETVLWIDTNAINRAVTQPQTVGYELARAMSAGAVLRERDLRSPMCAHRGDAVQVTYQRGSVAVRLTAVAQESGRRGERIRLRNTASSNEIRATLTDVRQAEIVPVSQSLALRQ